jgi:hypothetical protein
MTQTMRMRRATTAAALMATMIIMLALPAFKRPMPEKKKN